MKYDTLIFKLEGGIADIDVRYQGLNLLLPQDPAGTSSDLSGAKAGSKSGSSRPSPNVAVSSQSVGVPGDALRVSPFVRLRALKETMDPKKYEPLVTRIAKAADDIDESAISTRSLHMGAKNGLTALRGLGLNLILATELGPGAAEKFLSQNGIREYFGTVIARAAVDDGVSTEERIRAALNDMKIKSSQSAFICSSLGDISMAKRLGMAVFVLPSRNVPHVTMMQAKPNGMIISLEEIPSLLQLSLWR